MSKNGCDSKRELFIYGKVGQHPSEKNHASECAMTNGDAYVPENMDSYVM